VPNIKLHPEVQSILVVIVESEPYLRTCVKKLRKYFEEDARRIAALERREKHLLEFHHCNCELEKP